MNPRKTLQCSCVLAVVSALAAAGCHPPTPAPVNGDDACGKTVLAAGDYTRTLAQDGVTRTYQLHVPTGHSADHPAPLVLLYHGINGTTAGVEQGTQFVEKSDAEGFVLARPEGHGTSAYDQTWNAGTCCGAAQSQGIDDVAFTESLLKAVPAETCIDQKSIYAVGLSNGGMLVHRLACALSNRLAAIAAMAGPRMDTDACATVRPVALMQIHGMADTCTPFNGGASTFPGAPAMTSIPDTVNGWVTRNGCSATTQNVLTHGGASCDAYQGCPTGGEVELCTVQNGGHNWPGGPVNALQTTCGGSVTTDLDATTQVWNFLAAHHLP